MMARSQPQLGGMQQGYAGYDQSGAYGGYGQQQYTQYGQPANAPQVRDATPQASPETQP